MDTSNSDDQVDVAASTPASRTGAQLHRAELVYRCNQGKPVRKNILRTTTLIGSHDSCNLQLKASNIEPSHCVLTLDGRGFRIWDLRSRIGTVVNGLKVKSARLKDGDEIRIGSFVFTLETTLVDETRQGFFIDEYRVLGILGTGGMGWLYVVEDGRTQSRHALKVLTRRTATARVEQDELRTRFLFEGKAGNRLRNPHIVEVLDYQHRPDVEYLLMELFESINLQELVHRDGPLDPGLVCYIGFQAALALDHIHQNQLIHRDVKPANILVAADGHTKICDFGLVFVGDDPDELSLAAQMGNDCLGTADYISPEQSYDSYKIDHRADLYSLGCSLFFALTGDLPFAGASTREKINAHRSLPCRSITKLNPDVPEAVATIVERCMAKSPEDRFASGRELADALRPLASGEMHVEFDFEHLIKKRTNHASFRLADPKKKHYLQRIPANVASSLQAISSNDRMGDDHTVLEPPQASGVPTGIPGDTSAARDLH